jgi:hypothetical protein
LEAENPSKLKNDSTLASAANRPGFTLELELSQTVPSTRMPLLASARTFRAWFTHRVSLTTIKSALQFCTAVFVEMYVSGAAAQVIVPSVNVPTPATVADCTNVGFVAPVVHVPEQDWI